MRKASAANSVAPPNPSRARPNPAGPTRFAMRSLTTSISEAITDPAKSATTSVTIGA